MPEIIKVVGAVIFNKKIESYFLGQRSNAKRHPLKWEFIGGKVKPGESLFQAIEREVREEVGLSIKAQELRGNITYDYGEPVGVVKVNFIKCSRFKGEPTIDPLVYQKCRWVPRADLILLDWIEADKGFAMTLI